MVEIQKMSASKLKY